MVSMVELFAGIGAGTMAAKEVFAKSNMAFRVRDYVEIKPSSVASYNAMFDDLFKFSASDVRDWTYQPDILLHGSPCQSFSISGKQEGGDRGSHTVSSLLWYTVDSLKVMGKCRPRYVVWENVKNALSSYMVHTFNLYVQELAKMGYRTTYQVLDARDFGLPQARQRVFAVSVLEENSFSFDDMKRIPMKRLGEFLEKDVNMDIYGVRQPSMLKDVGGKSVKRAVVLDPDAYAYTITCRQDRTPAQIIAMPNGKYRYLTERECWRLNGYEDCYFNKALEVNPSKANKMNRVLYGQAGNTIAVPILCELFRTMFCK